MPVENVQHIILQRGAAPSLSLSNSQAGAIVWYDCFMKRSMCNDFHDMKIDVIDWIIIKVFHIELSEVLRWGFSMNWKVAHLTHVMEDVAAMLKYVLVQVCASDKLWYVMLPALLHMQCWWLLLEMNTLLSTHNVCGKRSLVWLKFTVHWWPGFACCVDHCVMCILILLLQNN